MAVDTQNDLRLRARKNISPAIAEYLESFKDKEMTYQQALDAEEALKPIKLAIKQLDRNIEKVLDAGPNMDELDPKIQRLVTQLVERGLASKRGVRSAS